VNEAYLRLVAASGDLAEPRSSFALAATVMLRRLMCHAEVGQASKRGGRRRRITLEAAHAIGEAADP
jgi:hypothetical protein